MKHARILVVDDDSDVLTAVRLLLKQHVAAVITEHNPEQIPALLAKEKPDLVLLDMNFKSTINTGNEGLYWLNRIKSIKSDLPVVMITAYGAIDLAVTSLKQGAADFVVKPWQNEQLISIVTDLLSTKERKKTNEHTPGADMVFIGESAPMQDLRYKISKIAPTDANILILGENGTGKDLIATAIHKQSNRADKPFIKVDV